MEKILRIFPRRTNATPDDADVRIAAMPTLFDEADRVHISVAFTWDMEWSEKAAKAWSAVAPVSLGGPAFNQPGGDFMPGMYMKHGYVITSRGCPNRCWFCTVPKREGDTLRELPVTDGWILTDDNILACSPRHIAQVFTMLARQSNRPRFVGGLEAKLLTPLMAKRLKLLNPERLYFAYDTPDDLEPLQQAGRYLMDAGFKRTDHNLRSYVLIGYHSDTFDKATTRLRATWEAGFFPMAMLYRDQRGLYDKQWRQFQREWASPRIIACKIKEIV